MKHIMIACALVLFTPQFNEVSTSSDLLAARGSLSDDDAESMTSLRYTRSQAETDSPYDPAHFDFLYKSCLETKGENLIKIIETLNQRHPYALIISYAHNTTAELYGLILNLEEVYISYRGIIAPKHLKKLLKGSWNEMIDALRFEKFILDYTASCLNRPDQLEDLNTVIRSIEINIRDMREAKSTHAISLTLHSASRFAETERWHRAYIAEARENGTYEQIVEYARLYPVALAELKAARAAQDCDRFAIASELEQRYQYAYNALHPKTGPLPFLHDISPAITSVNALWPAFEPRYADWCKELAVKIQNKENIESDLEVIQVQERIESDLEVTPELRRCCIM